MKRIVLWMSLIGGTIAVAATEPEAKFYFGGEIGPAFLLPISVHVPNAYDFKLESDVGFRVDLSFGYRLNSSLAVELNGGVLQNRLQDIAQHDFYQIPIMANLIWRYAKSDFAPFVGVGAGGIDLMTVPTVSGNGSTQDHFAFGGQTMAGFRYRVSRNWELGLTWKFLAASSADFKNGSSLVELGPSYSHCLLASCDFRF